MTEQQIDLRTILPMDRHKTVFKTFDELDAGNSFTLVVDHDPKPLHSQFEAQRPGAFSWQYVEQGPAAWKVKIAKTTDLNDDTSDDEGCCGSCGGS